MCLGVSHVGLLYSRCGEAAKYRSVAHLDNHSGDFRKAATVAEQAQFELYDMKTALAEKHDISSEHPGIYRELKLRHFQWLKNAIAK